MPKSNPLINMVGDAFKFRARPDDLIASKCLADFEIDEIKEFCVSFYRLMNEELLDDNYEVLSALTPNAFAYYLPMVISYSLEYHSVDNMSVDTIIGYLDRSDQAENWEDFFVERWSLLSLEELTAVEEWIMWLSDQNSDASFESRLSRGFDVIDTLKKLKSKGAENQNT